MRIYVIALVMFGVGALAGVVNALVSGNHFLMPRLNGAPPRDVVLPGLVATMLVGGIAAVVTWGLFGSACGIVVDAEGQVTLGSVVAAAIVGLAGSRWFTHETDRTLLRKALVIAAGQPSSKAKAAALQEAPPVEALRIVNET